MVALIKRDMSRRSKKQRLRSMFRRMNILQLHIKCSTKFQRRFHSPKQASLWFFSSLLPTDSAILKYVTRRNKNAMCRGNAQEWRVETWKGGRDLQKINLMRLRGE